MTFKVIESDREHCCIDKAHEFGSNVTAMFAYQRGLWRYTCTIVDAPASCQAPPAKLGRTTPRVREVKSTVHRRYRGAGRKARLHESVARRLRAWSFVSRRNTLAVCATSGRLATTCVFLPSTRAPVHGVAARRALPISTPYGASHPTDDKYSDVNVDTMNVFMGSYDASLAMSNL